MNKIRQNLLWLSMLSPAVVAVAALIGYPLVRAAYSALFRWNGLAPPRFIGFKNFADLGHDPYFWSTLAHTLIFAICVTLGTVGIGFLLALAISRKVWGYSVYRFCFYLSVMLPMTVTAALWVRIYEANFGLLNTALRAVGLSALALPWLASVDLSLGSVIAVAIWQFAGFPMIVLLTAIERIPEDIHEAATLDGVTGAQRLFYVVAPMVWPVLLSISVVQLVFSLRVFDLIWVMTKGGPAESSSVLGTYLYKKAFQEQQLGYASAVSIAMFTLIFCITTVYQRYSRNDTAQF